MSAFNENTFVIRTPEGISFSMPLAGPVARAIAWFVDFAIVYMVVLMVYFLVSLLGYFLADFASAVLIISLFVASFFYKILLEWKWKGQTLGKKVMRIRVVDEHGLRLRFNQVVIRNLMRVVDSLPVCYFVGGASCLVSQRGQRLGDLVANTIVVRIPRLEETDLSQVTGEKYNSLRAHAHLCARLRQNTNPHTGTLALRALIRRELIEPESRILLFQEIADYFKSLVQFPEEVVLGMTDEQYVRNVVDILFNREGPKAEKGEGTARPPTHDALGQPVT